MHSNREQQPAPTLDRLRAERWRGIASLRRHTARGVLLNGAFDLGLIALSAVRGLIVAAFLTKSQYGVWGLLGLAMWTALGLKNQFGAGDKYIQQSEADQRAAFQTAFTVEALFAAFAAPVAAGVVVVYALLSHHTMVLAPGLALLLLLPAVVLQFPATIFYRRMDYRRQRLLQAVDPVIAAIVTVGCAIAGAGYWSFVIGLLTGSWIAAFLIVRASPYPIALRFRRGMLRPYLHFSLPLLIAGLGGILMFQVIYMIGSSALGLAGLGMFTLVGNFVQFTDQADATVTNTLYPGVCAVRDRLDLLAEIFIKSNRLSLMWAVPFGVGLTLFAQDLFRFILGPRWLPAAPLLEIMGIVTALNHVGYNWTAFFQARSRTWPIAVLGIVPVIVVVGAGIPLMYDVGVTGLGYAFVLAAVVGLSMRGVLLARFFQNFRLHRHLLRAFLPSILAALPVLLLHALNGGDRTGTTAAAAFVLYLCLTVAATIVFERPLLREAIGYLLAKSAPTNLA
jgi:O-antigen/teichoic acid export membrane protein